VLQCCLVYISGYTSDCTRRYYFIVSNLLTLNHMFKYLFREFNHATLVNYFMALGKVS